MIESITLLGSSSGRNAGDAALLSAIMDSVDKACEKRILYEIPTTNPSFVRTNYRNRVHPVAILPWNLSLRMLGPPTYRSIMRTDLSLVFDAVLFDRALFNPLFNFLSALYLLLPRARRQGKRMALFNVGVGPVGTKLGRKMLCAIAESMDFITVRDKHSVDILRNIGVQNARVMQTADSALNVASSDEGRLERIFHATGLDPHKPVLAVNINQYVDTWANNRGRRIGRTQFLHTCAAALHRVVEKTGALLLFISTQHRDVAITRALITLLAPRTGAAHITNVEYSHADLHGILAKVDLLFAMRLHALILGTSSFTPVVGLAYQPKVSYYLASLGLHEHTIDFDTFSEDTLVKHLLNGWGNRVEIRRQLGEMIPRKQQDALKAAELVRTMHNHDDLDTAFARLGAG